MCIYLFCRYIFKFCHPTLFIFILITLIIFSWQFKSIYIGLGQPGLLIFEANLIEPFFSSIGGNVIIKKVACRKWVITLIGTPYRLHCNRPVCHFICKYKMHKPSGVSSVKNKQSITHQTTPHPHTHKNVYAPA
jgi:hypothetical protein